MGKMHIEVESEYNIGDIVVFYHHNSLRVGLVEGYYLDDGYVWYNIRTSPIFVFTYSNGGDIAEWDIKMKLEGDGVEAIRQIITIGEQNDY